MKKENNNNNQKSQLPIYKTVMWYYNNKPIESLSDLPKNLQDSYGFVYKISLYDNPNEDPLVYYGQKTIKTDAKRIVGARELKEKGKSNFNKYKSKKGKKKGQWVYFEKGVQETWKDYNSSSEIVKEMIAKGVEHKKEILEFTSKALLNYREHSWIMCEKCMETDRCLNLKIGNFYSKNIQNAIKKLAQKIK